MYQLKAFKHYIDYGNDKLDDMKAEREIYDNNSNNAIAMLYIIRVK